MRTHEDIRYANHSDVRQVCSCSDCALDVASASNRQSDRFDLLRARRGLDWLEKIAPSAHSRFWVENYPNPTNLRHDLLKQFQPLFADRGLKIGESRHVSVRMRETHCKATSNWV